MQNSPLPQMKNGQQRGGGDRCSVPAGRGLLVPLGERRFLVPLIPHHPGPAAFPRPPGEVGIPWLGAGTAVQWWHSSEPPRATEASRSFTEGGKRRWKTFYRSRIPELANKPFSLQVETAELTRPHFSST